MTDDIVARLRDTHRTGYFAFSVRVDRKLLTDAADEIERMRNELKAWQDAHRAHPDEFGGNPE